MEAHRLESLEANAGQYVVARLSGVEDPVTTREDTIIMALRTALAVDAAITVETEPNSNVIRRIEAFEVSGGVQPQPGMISRLATQRNGQTGKHHLEVFVLQGNRSERTFNVPDLGVQQLCHSTALAGQRLDFDEREDVITRVTVKGKPSAV